ncbi:MAG: DUF4268 domain-containing protein [Parvibaculum sp.]
MNSKPLGRLERVDLRQAWVNEASEFTPWLAQAENLQIVAETISMELELEAQEKNVGPFRADILCKDVESDQWVLIENQLERTDHTHLGQLLTYASGLQAVTIIWVAARFTEEHRATLDWLNEITDTSFRFFGLEVELWRIGGSPVAPRFNVISKPNNWTKSVASAARKITGEGVSETKAQQLRYWQAFQDYLEAHNSPVRIQTPQAHHWAVSSIGRTGFGLFLKVNTFKSGRISAELFIRFDDAKSYFALLHEQKDTIEKELGESLSWEDLPERIGCRIALYKTNVDPTDEDDWANQHAWLASALERFDRVFRARVRLLDLTAPDENPED